MWWWTLAAAADPSAVSSIRARWTAVQEVREELVQVLIDGNPTERSWPAVGEHRPVVTCFRETLPDEPYPAPRAALVEVRFQVAAFAYRRTYLYGSSGELLFAHSTDLEQPEWRVYWSKDGVVRVQKDAEVVEDKAAGRVPETLQRRGQLLQDLCVTAIRGTEGVPALKVD